jgi:acyl-coenzyme A synthetase/AMP-(fatty) acid ligase
MSLALAPAAAPSVGFVDGLSRWAERPALAAHGVALTYSELARRVDAAAEALRAGRRRLVVLGIEPTVDSVVEYLSALAAGLPVVVSAPERVEALSAAWRPDDVADLHPDLALLLSTSGTTGSPRLVRLSHTALSANAVDIAEALDLTDADVGITTLPLHYCYGLSVLHSHLAVGASVVLTDASVVDPGLWDSMRGHGVTNLAGVPHTFELLASASAPTSSVPTLRLVTQAGGRLCPERVRHWAARGQAEGWDLRVMYGQTVAPAGMTVTRPGQAAADPATVGHPVGAGRLVVRRDGVEVAAGEVGELYFVGPGVMDGYAESPADLARGRDVDELATGDLGRVRADGSVEIVGRRSGFLKIAGLRVDVQQVEDRLAARGVAAVVGGDDDGLRVVVEGPADPARSFLVEATGLPTHRIGVVSVTALPRLPHGKLDRPAAEKAYAAAVLSDLETDDSSPDDVAALVALYAKLLGRPDATAEATVVSLGGDSLSYVELSLRLEERIGELPLDWQRRTVAELARRARPERTAFARIDLTILLRAVAIVAIVGTHVKLFTILGGSHLLLGVAGFNFARFTAALDSVGERVRHVGGTLARIAVPAAIWTGVTGALFSTYTVGNVFMVNWLTGPDRWGPTWRLWFLEALVWTLVVCVGLLAIKPLRNAYSRNAFAVAFGIAVVSSIGRLDVIGLTSPPGRGTLPAVMWLFAIGWAANVARTRRQRLLLSLLPLLLLPGFLDNAVREALVGAGLLALIWVRSVAVPRVAVPVLATLAGASMDIYLTHFDIYRATPWPPVNLVLGVGLGIAMWHAAGRLEQPLRRLLTRTSTPSPTPEESHR